MNVLVENIEKKRKPLERSLFSPAIDFLFMGGGYLLILLPIIFFFPKDSEVITQVSLTFLVLANFINHPHFIHSYHIFYRDFFNKLFDENFILKRKFIFAGVIVPLLMCVFFTYCFLVRKFNLLGYAGNAMVFFVGWHYVKQGYGMLMVSSVLKRNFYTEIEKKILLTNSYIVWIFVWLYGNSLLNERALWGVEYFTIEVPSWMLWLVGIPLAISGVITAFIFIRQCSNDYQKFPKNGVIAYITALYIWLLLPNIHPVLIFIIPAFHSMQYMVVVWRYEINRSVDEFHKDTNQNGTVIGIKRRLINFALLGLVAGGLGFWLAPIMLDSVFEIELSGFSPTTFIFIFWVFINIHHFFIDNVIWRKENTDVSKYLFS